MHLMFLVKKPLDDTNYVSWSCKSCDV